MVLRVCRRQLSEAVGVLVVEVGDRIPALTGKRGVGFEVHEPAMFEIIAG